MDAVLAVAIVANLLSYLLSTTPGTVHGTGYDAREIAAVLPLGAVLAGRVFGTELGGPALGTVPGAPALGTELGGPALGGVAGRARGWAQLNGGAESRVRSKISIFISFTFSW